MIFNAEEMYNVANKVKKLNTVDSYLAIMRAYQALADYIYDEAKNGATKVVINVGLFIQKLDINEFVNKFEAFKMFKSFLENSGFDTVGWTSMHNGTKNCYLSADWSRKNGK